MSGAASDEAPWGADGGGWGLWRGDAELKLVTPWRFGGGLSLLNGGGIQSSDQPRKSRVSTIRWDVNSQGCPWPRALLDINRYHMIDSLIMILGFRFLSNWRAFWEGKSAISGNDKPPFKGLEAPVMGIYQATSCRRCRALTWLAMACLYGTLGAGVFGARGYQESPCWAELNGGSGQRTMTIMIAGMISFLVLVCLGSVNECYSMLQLLILYIWTGID